MQANNSDWRSFLKSSSCHRTELRLHACTAEKVSLGSEALINQGEPPIGCVVRPRKLGPEIKYCVPEIRDATRVCPRSDLPPSSVKIAGNIGNIDIFRQRALVIGEVGLGFLESLSGMLKLILWNPVRRGPCAIAGHGNDQDIKDCVYLRELGGDVRSNFGDVERD